MNSPIGLTEAGILLGSILQENNPVYKHKIIRFINKFTVLVKRFRLIMKNEEANDKKFLFELIKIEYNKRLNTQFADIKNTFEFSLMRNYINTITHPDFVSNTKFQISKRNSTLV